MTGAYALSGSEEGDGRDSASAERAAAVASASAALSRRLGAALDGYLTGRAGRVSVAIADRASGVVATYRPDLTFETASIVKVDVLATLLLTAQDAGRELTAEEETLAGRMIGESSNAATDALWPAVGGSRQIAAANQRLGLTRTVPSAEAWGRTETTAADQLRLLDVLLNGAGAIEARGVAQARALMGAVAAGQSWGVSAAARPGETFELKNGWVTRDADENRWLIHSVGVLRGSSRTVTLVVLSDGHDTMQAGIDLVEQVAAIARDQL